MGRNESEHVDVVPLTGVRHVMASHAANGSHAVNEATRARAPAAIGEFGFGPNADALSLAQVHARPPVARPGAPLLLLRRAAVRDRQDGLGTASRTSSTTRPMASPDTASILPTTPAARSATPAQTTPLATSTEE